METFGNFIEKQIANQNAAIRHLRSLGMVALVLCVGLLIFYLVQRTMNGDASGSENLSFSFQAFLFSFPCSVIFIVRNIKNRIGLLEYYQDQCHAFNSMTTKEKKEFQEDAFEFLKEIRKLKAIVNPFINEK